jgi:hypothetical protein
MQIRFAPDVALQLETIAVQTNGLEFSGFGFVEIDKETNTFYVYKFILLDVGSTGWTEIPSRKMLELMELPDYNHMKLWLHRHPVGTGIPGPHNWSKTDERTCRFEPLGAPFGMQDSVKWALAAVRTPRGWVGRYDTFGPKGKTVHMEVVPGDALAIAAQVDAIKAEKVSQRTLPYLRQVAPMVDWDQFGGEEFDSESLDLWLEEQGIEDPNEIEDFIQTYFWGGR